MLMQHAHLLAAVAVGHHLLDVLEELELVLDVLGREHGTVIRATLDAAHVLDAVDDLQVAVASMKPASLVWYQPSAVSTSAVAAGFL